MNLFDDNEWSRWINQARHTLKASLDDQKAGNFNWACFKAQQAAEYTAKALLRGLGDSASGRSVFKLLDKFSEKGINVPQAIETNARTLDIHYIPSRYPNAYPEGSPYEFYEESHSVSAARAAKEIIEFVEEVRGKLAQSP